MDRRTGAGAPTPPGWRLGADGEPYPPPPWQLGATLLLGVFRVPSSRLPATVRDAVPREVTLVGLGGQVLVGVAFVRYHPGGVLAYRELLVAVLGHGRRGAPRCSIGQIWVDSPASRTGGRELWAIPKELGALEWGEEAAGRVRCGLAGVAGLVARPGRALAPWAMRASLVVAQNRGDGEPVLTRGRIVARPAALQAAWTFDAEGPLGYLAAARATAGIAFGDASITFGVHLYR